MKAGLITQARMTSTRLPGKVLLPLAGDTVLSHHVRRLGWSALPIVVATTTNSSDDELVAEARRLACPVFRGGEDDVLARFHGAALAHQLDLIVRVTSDCPLIDGTIISDAVRRWRDECDPFLYLSNTLNRTYPRGFDFEIFSFELLDLAFRNATSRHEREHVTPYMYTGMSTRVRTESYVRESDGADEFRLTLDTPPDYELFKVLFEGHSVERLDAERIIEVLRRHPEIVAVNRHIQQKRW